MPFHHPWKVISAWLVFHLWPLNIELNLIYPQRTAQVTQSLVLVIGPSRAACISGS